MKVWAPEAAENLITEVAAIVEAAKDTPVHAHVTAAAVGSQAVAESFSLTQSLKESVFQGAVAQMEHAHRPTAN